MEHQWEKATDVNAPNYIVSENFLKEQFLSCSWAKNSNVLTLTSHLSNLYILMICHYIL